MSCSRRGENSFFPDVGEFQTLLATNESYDDENRIINLTVNYDLGFANLVSSTSYLDREFERVSSFEDLLTLFFGFPAQSQSRGRINNQVEGIVQEFRLSSNGDERLDWVAGIYYEEQDRFYDQDSITPGFDAFFGVPSTFFGTDFLDSPFEGVHDMQTREYSVFGEITYALRDDLDFTAGIRYFDWEQDYNLLFTGLANGGVTAINDESNDETGVNPRFALTYHYSENVTFYGNAAKGFRFGGVNEFVSPVTCEADLAALGLSAAPTTFESDELWNYELGAKTSLLDRSLSVNVSAFYIDWDNVQTLNQLPCAFQFKENLGSVKSEGLELEVVAQPTERLTLTLGSAYTNSESGSDNVNLGASDGDRVPYFPAFTLNASAQYEFPAFDGWNGLLRFDVAHQGSYFTAFDRTLPTTFEVPDHTIGNLRIGFSNEKLDVSLFVNNLWDERAITFEQDAFIHSSVRYVVRPRWAGVNFNMNF